MNRRHSLRVLGAAGALASLGAGRAAAQPNAGRSFTVISEMAREIRFVVFEATIGTRINANQRTSTPVTDGSLDTLALRATRQFLRKQLPDSKVSLVAPLPEDLFPTLDRADEGDSVVWSADVRDVLREHGSRELIVWRPVRAPIRVRMKDAVNVGTGTAEGVGFYLDRQLEVVELTSNQSTQGVLANFFHARAVRIDVPTARVVKVVQVAESRTFVNVRADTKSSDAWDSLTNQDKVKAIVDLMVDKIESVVPPLLAGA